MSDKQDKATAYLREVLNDLLWKAAPWTAKDKIKVAKFLIKKFELNDNYER